MFLYGIYFLTWSALEKASWYFIMRRKPEGKWKVVAIVNSSQTSYRVNSHQFKWKIVAKTFDGKKLGVGEAKENNSKLIISFCFFFC